MKKRRWEVPCSPEKLEYPIPRIAVAVNRDRDVAVAVAKMDMSNCVRKIIRIFIYIFYLEARTTSIWGSCFHYPDGRIIFKQKERSSAPTSLTLKISPTAVMTFQSSLSRRPSPSP